MGQALLPDANALEKEAATLRRDLSAAEQKLRSVAAAEDRAKAAEKKARERPTFQTLLGYYNLPKAW